MNLNKKHTQQIFLRMGDEYLLQYFLSGRRDLKGKLILSRLFSMGHCLELYSKAVLTAEDGTPPTGHDVSSLIGRIDANLLLTEEEIKAGNQLFIQNTSNIDLELWFKHEEALELYQAQYFLKDLKYYLERNGKIIYPVVKSLVPINYRLLNIVKVLRGKIDYHEEIFDKELIDSVEYLGYEENPAMRVTSK